MSKKDRIAIQRETIDFVNKNKSKFRSRIIKYNNNEPKIKNEKSSLFDTEISVVPSDTLEAVIDLQNKLNKLKNNTKVGFLVFANSTNPGGRYKEGTPAQEESICRRTNLVNCFSQMKYPISEFGSFYIKDLAIIRDLEKNNYNFFDKIIFADCVLSAAYHGPPINSNKLCDGFREKTKLKIQYLLNAFLENNNYNIVLGAFGCGAFGNPVNDIAELFKEVLNSEIYKNRFQNVVFAVLKEAGNENFKAFIKTFNQL